MKACHCEFVAEDYSDGLLSNDELKQMTNLAKKRKGPVAQRVHGCSMKA